MAKRILLVDDEEIYPLRLKQILERKKYEVETASNGVEALRKLNENCCDIVITDVKMPEMDGIELLKQIKRHYSDIQVIVMTAFGSIEKAVEAMKKGAFDYLTKPFSTEELILSIEKAIKHQKLINENRYLREKIKEKYQFNNIVGKNYKMQEIYEIIMNLADVDSTVLVQGETGTGKELIAQAIHYNSSRQGKPFVQVNCGVFSETLLESELFGHERGAFTGAHKRRIGRFEMAHQGSLFLDEIGDIPPTMQIKILRVLQEKEFERVGGSKTIKVDVRIIGATNQNIEKAITEKRFRKDLYYRLNVIPIKIPPLRERMEDIPLLAMHFLEKYRKKSKKDIKNISAEVIDKMMHYYWPGNVRELENIIERAVIITNDETIKKVDIPYNIFPLDRRKRGTSLLINDKLSFSEVKRNVLKTVEKEYLKRLLTKYKGNVSLTAKKTKLNSRTLYDKMKQYGLKKEKFK